MNNDTTKKKKTPQKGLKRKINYKAKLDKVFSEYIRLRNADSNGFCRCVTCGKHFHWTKIQNGHYMSRKYMSTRFSEMNCHPQCMPCNVMNHGNIPVYRMWLVKRYGQDEVERLEFTALNKVAKISEWEYRQMIEYYTKLVQTLKKHV